MRPYPGGPKGRSNADYSNAKSERTHGLSAVFAQREMENGRTLLVLIPPLRGADFPGIGGLWSDV
jgi:hypothetical protein